MGLAQEPTKRKQLNNRLILTHGRQPGWHKPTIDTEYSKEIEYMFALLFQCSFFR